MFLWSVKKTFSYSRWQMRKFCLKLRSFMLVDSYNFCTAGAIENAESSSITWCHVQGWIYFRLTYEAMKSSIRYANKRQWFGLRNPILTCWDFFSDLIYRLKFFYQRRKGKKKNQIIQRHEHKFLLLAKLWSKLFVTLMTCANLATSTGCHSAKLMVYWAMTQSYILAVSCNAIHVTCSTKLIHW